MNLKHEKPAYLPGVDEEPKLAPGFVYRLEEHLWGNCVAINCRWCRAGY